MNQYSFLTEKISPQIGLTIFLIIAILFLIFFFWNLQKTESEILFLEAYSPFSIKKKSFLGIGNPVKEIIKITVEKELLSFERKSFWLEEDFSKILDSKEKFEEREINSFRDNFSKNKIEISNLNFEILEKEEVTVLNCYLKGVLTEKGSFDFSWLLKNFPFDFSQFQIFDKSLSFVGQIKETKIEIYIEFPFSIGVSKDEVWQR